MSIFKSSSDQNPIDTMASKAGDMLDGAEQSAKQALSQVDRKAHELAADGASFMDLATERAHMYADKGTQMAKHASQAVKEKATHYADSASAAIKENPLKSIAIAAAVGATVAVVTSYALGRKSIK
jgi:ElaB/YqjD/DUF883 family membrane-anchored ribosome-binding protein